MMTIKQLSNAVKHAKLTKLSEEIGVSTYHLRRIRDEDGNIPYLQMKKVSEFFEGVTEDE